MFFLLYSQHLYVFCVRVVSVSVGAVPPSERPGETGPRCRLAFPHAAIGTSVSPLLWRTRLTPHEGRYKIGFDDVALVRRGGGRGESLYPTLLDVVVAP